MCPQNGFSPVHAAARYDYPKCIELLIAAKADPNIANNVSGRGLWRWWVLEWVGVGMGGCAAGTWWYW